MHIEDEIENFKQMFQAYSKLFSNYENYWEFWIVAHKTMGELNKQFERLKQATTDDFPDGAP